MLKNSAIKFADYCYKAILGGSPSSTMRLFTQNLSWSLLGGIVSSAIMLAITIMAGQILGPEGFGRYNAILSLAMAMSLLFTLGSDISSVRYLSDPAFEAKRGRIITASLFIVAVQLAVFVPLIFLLARFITRDFPIGLEYLAVGSLFSLVLAGKNLFDSYLRGLGQIKKQSFIRVIDASAVLLSFLIFFYLLNRVNYTYYVLAVSIGAIFTIVLIAFSISRNLERFTAKEAITVLRYNKFLTLTIAASFLMGLEKFIIGKYIGIKELGIYSAYYASSFLIISQLGIYFMNVYWPAAIKNKANLRSIVIKTKKLLIKLFPIWVVLDMFAIALALLLLGGDYPLNFAYLLIFAVCSYIITTYTIFIYLLKIDNVKTATLIYFISWLISIILIVALKNLLWYLALQAIMFTAFYYYTERKLTFELVAAERKNNTRA